MQEKTLNLYKESGVRLQLVEISVNSNKEYEVRLNRKILVRFLLLDHALSYFRGKVYQYVSQTKMF